MWLSHRCSEKARTTRERWNDRDREGESPEHSITHWRHRGDQGQWLTIATVHAVIKMPAFLFLVCVLFPSIWNEWIAVILRCNFQCRDPLLTWCGNVFFSHCVFLHFLGSATFFSLFKWNMPWCDPVFLKSTSFDSTLFPPVLRRWKMNQLWTLNFKGPLFRGRHAMRHNEICKLN